MKILKLVFVGFAISFLFAGVSSAIDIVKPSPAEHTGKFAPPDPDSKVALPKKPDVTFAKTGGRFFQNFPKTITAGKRFEFLFSITNVGTGHLRPGQMESVTFKFTTANRYNGETLVAIPLSYGLMPGKKKGHGTGSLVIPRAGKFNVCGYIKTKIRGGEARNGANFACQGPIVVKEPEPVPCVGMMRFTGPLLSWSRGREFECRQTLEISPTVSYNNNGDENTRHFAGQVIIRNLGANNDKCIEGRGEISGDLFNARNIRLDGTIAFNGNNVPERIRLDARMNDFPECRSIDGTFQLPASGYSGEYRGLTRTR
jgi:hypothetical protein